MGALPTGTTQEDFYGDATLQGGYQYTTIKDIVNNFMLTVVGDRNHIKYIEKDVVVFHAKRGLQELNYDVLKEIKGVEIDLSDALTLILPEDYVKYVRVSWVDAAGQFHPMVANEDTLIASAYLQDNLYNILFDGTGAVLTANENSYDQTIVGQNNYSYYRPNDYGLGYDNYYESNNARFGMQTDKANSNGWFTVDKRSGVMKFSSNVGTKTIVLEYISDGLEYADIGDIKVNKFAEKALMLYIEAEVLGNIDKVPEYVVKRKYKQAHVQKLKAKTRLSGLNYEELLQVLRGKDKRLK
tara:strand:+ start:10135 stop:11028 length:894 start_codon:yes stop_codon:yes gene_type:complete